MESETRNLICDVCKKEYRDPYILPCGHTFCLRPCLLSHPRALKATCMHCKKQFDANALRPDYSAAAHFFLATSSARQIEGDAAETSEEPVTPGVFQCSNCRQPMEREALQLCPHCHRSTCAACRDKHFESFAVTIRVRASKLLRQKSELVESSKSLKGLAKSTEETSVSGISERKLADAASRLRSAATGAFEKATDLLNAMEVETYSGKSSSCAAGKEGVGLNSLVDELLTLSDKIQQKTASIYDKLDTQDLKFEEVMWMHKVVRELQEASFPIIDSVLKLEPFPMTKMRVSEQFVKIGQLFKGLQLLQWAGDTPPPPGLSGSSLRGESPSPEVEGATESRVKLFINGLKPLVTETILKKYFEDLYGPLVECCIPRDPKTKQPRGFAFVTFRREQDAQTALQDPYHFVEGAPIIVRPYKNDTEGRKPGTADAPPTTGQSSSNGPNEKDSRQAESSSRPIDRFSLYVGNLKPTTKSEMLKTYFSVYGSVTRVELHQKGRNKFHMAFVRMATEEAVKKVLAVKDHVIDGSRVTVKNAFVQASTKKPSSMGKTGSGKTSAEANILSALHEDKAATKGRNSSRGQVASTSKKSGEQGLLVTGLSQSITRQDVLSHFAQFGGVKSLRIDDAKGEATLVPATKMALFNAFARSDHRIRSLPVRLSVVQMPDVSEDVAGCDNVLLVSDFSPGTTKSQLVSYFGRYGKVVGSRIIDRGSYSIAFITMATPGSVESAITANKAHCIDGCYLAVRRAYGRDEAKAYRYQSSEPNVCPIS